MDYAIVVGINEYTPIEQDGLPTLRGAVDDANMVEQWLLSATGGKVPKDNCRKITSKGDRKRPLKDDIDDELQYILEQIIDKGIDANRFYFYFAGHGIGVETNTQDTGLCLAKWSSIRRNYALSIQKYLQLMIDLGYFKQLIFWADCCRGALYNISPEGSTIQLSANGPNAGRAGYFLGYATQYQDPSYEAEIQPGETRGIFTEVLLSGLKGAAANENGEVDADYLRDYLFRETQRVADLTHCKQIPRSTHSFTAADPCIFHRVNNTVAVTFQFSNAAATIHLVDGSGELVQSFDTRAENPVTIQLKKGLYKLEELGNGHEDYFDVSPENPTMHVNF